MITNKQRRDIESIMYFIPKAMKGIEITESDIEAFLELDTRGIGENKGKFAGTSGFDALQQGKRWREWHCGAWEETILEGTIPLYDLLIEGMPDSVVDYISKSMFKGKMREQIIKLNNELKWQKENQTIQPSHLEETQEL